MTEDEAKIMFLTPRVFTPEDLRRPFADVAGMAFEWWRASDEDHRAEMEDMLLEKMDDLKKLIEAGRKYRGRVEMGAK